MSDRNIMDNAAFDSWLMEQRALQGMSDDELLVEVVSHALREDTVEGRAQGLIDLANLRMLMADKSMGSCGSIATCLTIVRN
jgi:tRNA(Ile2) C34 agmatinyltransferase TiaS